MKKPDNFVDIKSDEFLMFKQLQYYIRVIRKHRKRSVKLDKDSYRNRMRIIIDNFKTAVNNYGYYHI